MATCDYPDGTCICVILSIPTSSSTISRLRMSGSLGPRPNGSRAREITRKYLVALILGTSCRYNGSRISYPIETAKNKCTTYEHAQSYATSGDRIFGLSDLGKKRSSGRAEFGSLAGGRIPDADLFLQRVASNSRAVFHDVWLRVDPTSCFARGLHGQKK